MSELLSPDSTLFRVNQDRQKPKFQDSQTLSPFINKLDVSSTDLRFPLSSGCINQKAIQDIEISYEQSLKSSGLSFLISDSDEWQESVNEQCLPSALSSEEESIDGEDSDSESETCFHPVLFQKLADNNYIINDSKQVGVDVCSEDLPKMSKEPQREVAEHSMFEFMELMRLFSSEQDEEVLSDMDLDDFQISIDRVRDGVPFNYAADMECALGIDDETLNIPVDADLVCGEGLEQRVTRSMAKAIEDAKNLKRSMRKFLRQLNLGMEMQERMELKAKNQPRKRTLRLILMKL